MAELKGKSTDQVQLKLVTVKRSKAFNLHLDDPETWPLAVQFLFYPRPLGRQQFFAARVVLRIAMIFFTGQLFLLFGKPLITSLGGSLFQIIMLLVFCFALWIKPRDLLGASVGLWWSFENFIDVAPYVNDAIRMRLMLTSGGTGSEAPYGFHDWNFILSETGLLTKCEKNADGIYAVGYAGMALCCLWAGWSLFYYFRYQRE